MRTIQIIVALFCLALGGWTHGVGYIPQTYYLSPSGSDSNNGTSSGTPWLTPAHNINCGDTIIEAAGSYNANNFQRGAWGVIKNCPSTAGVYFASLKCPSLTACIWSISSGGVNLDMVLDQSNWAIIGGEFSTTGTSGTSDCIAVTPSTTANIHHIALINLFFNGCNGYGIHMVSFYANAAYSVDYLAVVGAVVYAAQGQCPEAVEFWQPSNYDTLPGTHWYLAGVFAWDTIGGIDGGTCPYDGNGVNFDTWGTNNYTGQTVAEQSLLIGNYGPGLALNGVGTAVVAPWVVRNVTTYGNNLNPASASAEGEIGSNYNTQGAAVASLENNIAVATAASENSYLLYGMQFLNFPVASVVSGNYVFNSAVSSSSCGTGQNFNIQGSAGFTLGSNTCASPNFVNPVIPGAPSCNAYSTTTACMSGLGIIANFVAQAGGAAGLGYQPPGNCTADAYFPTWLNGIIPIGLITQPCGTN